MAVALDTTAGTNAQTGVGDGSLTTTAAIAASSVLLFCGLRFRGGGASSSGASGGGLTWANLHSATSGSIGLWIYGAIAPAGLASSTALTINGAGTGEWTTCALAYSGVDVSGTVSNAVRAFANTAAGTAAWSSGAIGGNAGDAYVACAAGDGTLRTSTPTAPGVERVDFNSATSSGSITVVDEIGGGAGETVAGTFSGTLAHLCVALALKPAAGGAAPPVRMLASLGAGS